MRGLSTFNTCKVRGVRVRLNDRRPRLRIFLLCHTKRLQLCLREGRLFRGPRKRGKNNAVLETTAILGSRSFFGCRGHIQARHPCVPGDSGREGLGGGAGEGGEGQARAWQGLLLLRRHSFRRLARARENRQQLIRLRNTKCMQVRAREGGTRIRG